MASIERTAYPQFKRNPVVRELVAAYTPTDAELAFITESARQPGHRLTLAMLLKSFQRLGYFPAIDDVPAASSGTSATLCVTESRSSRPTSHQTSATAISSASGTICRSEPMPTVASTWRPAPSMKPRPSWTTRPT